MIFDEISTHKDIEDFSLNDYKNNLKNEVYLLPNFPNFPIDNLINDNNDDLNSGDKQLTNLKTINYKKENNNDNEEKSKYKNNSQNKPLNKNSNIKKELNEKKEIQLPPKQYTSKEIKEIISKLDIDKKIKEAFIIDEKVNKIEIDMNDETFINIKRRNRANKIKTKKEKKKLGRKKKDEPENGKHTKHSNDNMIKKIKSNLLHYLIRFINNILNILLNDNNNKILLYIKFMKTNKKEKEYKIKDLIKKIDYEKTMNKTEKEINLKFLKMPLKDFLSQDISSKYKTLKKNANKRVIDEILLNENDNQIIKFLLEDLTLGDWIDIFTYKRELKDFITLDEEKNKIIMDNFTRVDKLLKEIYELHNENNYFSLFFSILYNFERWFFIKKGRQINRRKNEKES